MTSLTPRLRTALTLLLIVALGLVAGWTVLQAQPDVAGPTAARSAGQEEPTTEPTGTENATELLTEAGPLVTYEVYLARDPFDPVIPEPVSSASPGTGTSTDTPVPGTDPSASPSPGASPTGSPSPGASPTASPSPGASPTGSPSPGTTPDPGCEQSSEVVCDGREVTLVDVQMNADGETVAVIQVGTQLYEVMDGDRFAENFQVASIVDTCVTLLFGDDTFTLCEGERVLK